MTGIRVENVSHCFGSTRVLDDLSFSVQPGECVVLAGPSGSGKSTLLRILAGLLAPNSGRVWFGERDVTSLAPHARNVAMVFQDYATYPRLSVAGNLRCALERSKLSSQEINRRIEQQVARLDLAKLLDRLPSQLSGGQLQRVALARALIREPTVLLLDEPLSQLDVQLREELRNALIELKKEPEITQIFVTHDPLDALVVPDRIAVLQAGKFQQFDSPLAVRAAPVNEFARCLTQLQSL